MPESKKTKSVARSQQEKKRTYPTERLLKSRHLSGYQPDFARAILTEPEYTISGALEVLENKLKGGQ